MNPNPKTKALKARFKPEVRFALQPEPVGPFRANPTTAVDQLKAQLLGDALRNEADADVQTALQRAANEAAAIAWFSNFPLLVLPTLLEEKVARARQQVLRQRAITQRCRRSGGQAA